MSERHALYARDVRDELRTAGFRAELDDRAESLGRRIRDGQLQKVPYLLVVGDREAEGHAVAVRSRAEGEKGSLSVPEFISLLRQEVDERR